MSNFRLAKAARLSITVTRYKLRRVNSSKDRHANILFLFQKCQQAAWRHHHKFECACLHALNVETFIQEGSILDIPNLRSLVRLLLFQRSWEQRCKVGGELEAREYQDLQTNRKERENNEAFKESMEVICGVLREYTHFDLDVVKDYFCAVSPSLVASITRNTHFPNLVLLNLVISCWTPRSRSRMGDVKEQF